MQLCSSTVDRGLCIVLTMMTGAALFAAEAVGMFGGEHHNTPTNMAALSTAATDSTQSVTVGEESKKIDDDKKIALSSTKTTSIFGHRKNVSTNASPNTHANPRSNADRPSANDMVVGGSGGGANVVVAR